MAPKTAWYPTTAQPRTEPNTGGGKCEAVSPVTGTSMKVPLA
jgi:hypothetical protein